VRLMDERKKARKLVGGVPKLVEVEQVRDCAPRRSLTRSSIRRRTGL